MTNRAPLSGKVRVRDHRVYSEAEAKALLERLARNAYRAKRMYAGILGEATSSTRFDGEPTSGGGSFDGERHPTEDLALDLDKAALRRMLPTLCELMAVADAAMGRVLVSVRNADRMRGEQVGESGVWDTERAEREEQRAGSRGKSGVWRAKAEG